MNVEDFVWSQKYRPTTIDECILPTHLKDTFKSVIASGDIQDMLLSGSPGTGKSASAKAILDELDVDYIEINGSLSGNIDTLRNEIQNFASAVSFTGRRKCVLINEADHLTNATQAALRAFMEDYSSNCSFILTCNFKNRLMEPLHSRCACIEFQISKKDLPNLSVQFLRRACHILETENVEYDKKVVAALITKHCPDWRRVLNELQRYAVNGKIDEGILVNFSDDSFRSLIGFMKEKNFTKMRKWVGENSDIDANTIFNTFYETSNTHFQQSSVPELILLLAKYQYQSSFVANPEINITACLLEIMLMCPMV
jgi:DNA polymerase III delta prime subunit